MRIYTDRCPNKHCRRKGKGYRHGPYGYVAWQKWANKMSRTHDQLPCPQCGHLTIWEKRTPPPTTRETSLVSTTEVSR